MNYREKIEAYKNGSLSSEEAKEIEKDIEKFSALLEYFDDISSVEPVAVLSDNQEDRLFVENINKVINKRISKSTVNVILMLLLFSVFMFWGIGGDSLFDSLGVSQGLRHFVDGIFSMFYYGANIVLLYRAFVYKRKRPAIFLICWNLVLSVLSLVFSLSLGDAVPFVLPIIKGFYTLPQYAADIMGMFMNYIIAENVMDIFAMSLAPLSVVLSIISLILVKKGNSASKVSIKIIKLLTVCSFVFTVLISAGSTFVNYVNGYFPDDLLQSNLAAKEAETFSEEFIENNPLDKSDDEIKDILKNMGYSYFENSDSYRKDRQQNMLSHVYLNGDPAGLHRSVNIYFAYICKSPYITQNKLYKISSGEYFEKGTDEKEVLSELFSFGLIPSNVLYVEDYGEQRYTSVSVRVDVNKSQSYPAGYSDFMTFIFSDGKLTSFSSFLLEEDEY